MSPMWCLLLALATVSDSILVPGAITSVKAAMDHIHTATKSYTSLNDSNVLMSRFKIEPKKQPSLTKYFKETLPMNGTSNHSVYGNNVNGKVVVVARIGSYDKQGEEGVYWRILSDPVTKNNVSNIGTENELREHDLVNGSDSMVAEEVNRYIANYRDLLFTFKDYVTIGMYPNVTDKITFNKFKKSDNSNKFNVTYIMPIEKTKKYFEIKMTNLTELQYKEINHLLQEHIQKKTNHSNSSKHQDDEIFYVEIDNQQNQLSSRSLTENTSSPEWSYLQQKLSKNNTDGASWPLRPEEAATFINRVFTEEGYIDFFNKFTDNLRNDSKNDPTFPSDKSRSTFMKNNGFHAPIVTDYIKTHSDVTDSLVEHINPRKTQHLGQMDVNSKFENDDTIVATSTTILNPIYTNRNSPKINSLASKSPIKFMTNTEQNRRRIKTDEVDSSDTIPMPVNSFANVKSLLYVGGTTPPIPSKYENSIIETTESLNKTNKSMENQTNLVQNFRSLPINPFWERIFKQNNNITNNENHLLRHIDSKDLMEAAQWILEMKNKMEEEKRERNEYIKNYIKKFLGGEENVLFNEGGNNNSSVMKINRHHDTLEELKKLMIDYLKKMNFNVEINGSSTVVDSILNSTNIFELMEHSSEFIKLNLQTKMQIETKDPTVFIKGIVNNQIQKCTKLFNSSWFLNTSRKSPEIFKKNGYKFMILSKCINLKFQKCIIGFRIWLERQKFYLRPQFKLNRAYEMYEIENNLFCLRTYNATYLESNLQGRRIKPGKVLGNSGMRRLRIIPGKKGQQMVRFKNGKRSRKLNSRGGQTNFDIDY